MQSLFFGGISMPLADKYRPIIIDDVVGQSHIIGENKVINNMIEKNYFFFPFAGAFAAFAAS